MVEDAHNNKEMKVILAHGKVCDSATISCNGTLKLPFNDNNDNVNAYSSMPL